CVSLLGPIVHLPAPLAAYRITPGSLSSNRIRNLEFGVYVFDLLEKCYRKTPDKELLSEFLKASASKRREYAKVLLRVSDTATERKHIWSSLNQSNSPDSVSKSLTLAFLSYMPAQLQPTWPSNCR